MLVQKVKIKIQNDVIVHPSASLSANEYVKIYFNQSNQCFNALKCLNIVFSKWLKIVLMLIPGPLVDRTFSSRRRCSKGRRRQKWAIKTKILMLIPGPLVDRTFSSQVFKFFKSKGRRRCSKGLRVGPH